MSLTTAEPRHRLLEACGLEIEYAIVDAATLAVRPIADQILLDRDGSVTTEVEIGTSLWSNELAAHVIEVKAPAPVQRPSDLLAVFPRDLRLVNARLLPLGAHLLPTGAHPCMNPALETRLWPHHHTEIYGAYDRIFNCRTHGWSNLQSTHLNLSFGSDAEFSRLHTAIRLVLPIIPGLCAATPLLNGQLTGLCDSRLDVYSSNQHKLPTIAGHIIPERVHSRQEYQERILNPMYEEIAPLDPQGILRGEWLNSRGAIARFDRNAIEIRLIDSQECPAMDIVMCELIMNAVRLLTEERFASLEQQNGWDEDSLSAMLRATIRDGGRTAITDRAYLALFGAEDHPQPTSATELWQHLAGITPPAANTSLLETVFTQGVLADRIRRRLGPTPLQPAIIACYRELAQCLQDGNPFTP